MKHSSTLYVGLDVHKESIAVAYVSDAKDAEVPYLGSSGPASPTSISPSAGVHSKNAQLMFVYEVSPLPAAAGDELRRVRAIEWRLPRGHAMTRALRSTRIRIALAVLIAIGGAAGVMLLSGGASADGQKARVTSTDRWLPLAPSPFQRTEVGAARIGRFIYVPGGFVPTPSGATTSEVTRYDIRRQ